MVIYIRDNTKMETLLGTENIFGVMVVATKATSKTD
jgi:hypothetical protein